VGGVGVGRTLETPIGENKDKRATKSREKKKGPEKIVLVFGESKTRRSNREYCLSIYLIDTEREEREADVS